MNDTAKQCSYVSYYRVSTQKQGCSGLGLEAQHTLVDRLPKDGPVLAEYTEIETGKRSDRPELFKALTHARNAGAILVIAALSRLARNVEFTAHIMNSDVPFICCDHPSATRLTLHILAAVAEEECRLVSERTKAALAEAKKRGVLLGSARPGHWELCQSGWKKAMLAASKKRTVDAHLHYEILVPMLREQRSKGQTLAQIRDWLNTHEFKTTRKTSFTIGQVSAIIRRYV